MKPHHNPDANGQIFTNPFLEVLSKSPPLVSAGIYASIILTLLVIAVKKGVTGQVELALIIYLSAIIFWTFFEYLAHRYIFHLDHYFPKSKFARRISYIFHGIHHEYPRDVNRIIMPPAPGILIISGLFFIFWLIMGNAVYLFLAGFLSGYLIYTYVHYKSHVTPIPPYLKNQYRHHALHHYKYENMAFGVSSRFWDWVFGTLPPKT